MTMQRRSLLTLSAAGAAGVGGPLLGRGQARATARAGAPTRRFALGLRRCAWSPGSRRWTTYDDYPAPGSSPVTNAPVAEGAFPGCEFMLGHSSGPSDRAAGTRALALNATGDPLAGHLDTAVGVNVSGHLDTAVGVGVSGHSMGGMTTHGLLTAWPDARITAAIPMSCAAVDDPSPAVRVKALFTHGDRDGT